MASCPPPGPLTPPSGVPTVDFLGGKLKMRITDLWTKSNGWKPTSWTRVYSDTPEGAAIIARLYRNSQKKWDAIASLSDHRLITDVIKSTRWARTVGPFTVKLAVKPGETVSQYKARGGYLLWQDFFDTDSTPIDILVPSWVGTHDPIDGFHLNVKMQLWTAANTMPPHTSRPRPDLIGKAFFQVQATCIYPGTWDKTMDWIVNKVRALCNVLTGDKMQRAASVIGIGGAAFATTPAGEAAIAAAAVYQAIAAACGVAWPDCSVPALPPPTGGGGGAMVPGTIAWLDKRIGLYHLAVPVPLSGLTATHVETTTVAMPPGGVELVNRIAWESATKPFYRRTTFLVGSAAATLATVAAVLTLRRRHA